MLLPPLAKLAAALPSSIKLKLRRLRPLYGKIVSYRQRRVDLRCHGQTVCWQPDELTSQAFLHGTYEPEMRQAFAEFIRPGFVVYDVGSHAGYFAVTNALLVRPGGSVVAFEPRQSNVASIERQLRLNPDLSIRLLQIAVSDRDGFAMFDESPGSSEGALSTKGGTRVAIRSIDSLVGSGEIPPPSLIKIDVEGHEQKVLEGAVATIAAHQPIILLDYNEGDTLSTARDVLGPLKYAVDPGGAFILARPSI